MESTIKVISVVEKVAKNGNKYRLVYVEIVLDGRKEVRRIALF